MEHRPGSAHDATAGIATPERASVWEDFLDIFYAPSSVFARREHGSFWIPMLVVTVALGALFIVNMGVLEPIMDAEMRRGMAAMADDPRMTPEMIEQGRGFALGIAKVGAFIGIPIAILLIAAMLYFMGKVVGAKQTWHAALVVAGYAYVPRIIESVLVGVQGFFMDPSQLDGRYRVSLGIGRFLDPDTTSPVLIALVGRVDVFTIWVTVLLAIGLAVTGRIPRSKAAIAAALVWVLGGLPGVFQGLRS